MLLTNEGFEVISYFYNPNIFPRQEFDRRLNELKKVAQNLIFEPYLPDDFYNVARGFENCKEGAERCLRCFEMRLEKTAILARERKISDFTTTLTVSPHKNSQAIFEIGEKIAKKYGLNFLKYDFKKHDGFKITQKISNELGLYKQTYCGCEFSMR